MAYYNVFIGAPNTVIAGIRHDTGDLYDFCPRGYVCSYDPSLVSSKPNIFNFDGSVYGPDYPFDANQIWAQMWNFDVDMSTVILSIAFLLISAYLVFKAVKLVIFAVRGR